MKKARKFTEHRKSIECLRGKSGTMMVHRNDVNKVWDITICNRETPHSPRLVSVELYEHEAMRLYDFLGRVLQ